MTVVALAEAFDRARFGGKAAALAHGCVAGLPVPGGWALSWEAAAQIAEGRRAPPELAAGTRWAVRSSAVDEDGASASFAGQHLSRLHVRPRDVAVAIAEVVASGASASAQAYRARMGAAAAARMGVVLQVMVPAVAAGVMFTRSPMTGADELWVEATWGLGEAVVMGLVTPDSWRLSTAGEVLEHRTGLKDRKIVAAPDGAGTIEVDVDAGAVSDPCLSADDLAQLVSLARRLGEVFEGPHDVEFAFGPARRLFLLQRRSITT